jgi:hypothetical protein
MMKLTMFSLGLLVSGLGSFMAFRAVLDDHQAQSAIVAEFVSRYCHPPAGDQKFLMGEAAALSRVSIRSGAQPMAWAKYLECKAGL